VLAQSEDRGALQRFLPHWRSAIDALPGRRVRFALDVDPAGFA
jgi:primosomal protein N' (replication factor Y)